MINPKPPTQADAIKAATVIRSCLRTAEQSLDAALAAIRRFDDLNEGVDFKDMVLLPADDASGLRNLASQVRDQAESITRQI